MTTLKISCGCNSEQNPAIFKTIAEAEQHAKVTGHILTIAGLVTKD